MIATLSGRFGDAVGRRSAPRAGVGLVGLEQEYAVRDAHGGRGVDFATVLACRPDAGRRLDPADPLASRRPTGIVLTADGAEAEVAAPPVPLRPGFTAEVDGWAALARSEVAGFVPAGTRVTGYSTHLSVSVGGPVDEIARLFASTFAPALLLCARDAGAAGLFARPRSGRVEIGLPFLEGPALRAAALLAAGGVAACAAAAEGVAGDDSLPPRVQARLVPSVHRYGWYVDRAAFRVGSRERLRTATGRRIRPRDHAGMAWDAATAALGDAAGPADLAGGAWLAGGVPIGFDPPGPPVAPGELVALLSPRHRPAGLSVDAVAATWDFAVLRFATPGSRAAYACVPRDDLAPFFERLDRGALDALLLAYLAAPPGERRLEHHAQTGAPGLYDEVRIGPNLTPPERSPNGATVPGDEARRAKRDGLAGGVVPVLAGRGGCRPRVRWYHGMGVGLGLVGATAGGWVLLRDGGSTAGTPSVSAADAGALACGEGLEGPDLAWSALTEPCAYAADRPRYRLDLSALDVTAVEVSGDPGGASVCVDHSRTSTDPITGRQGLSTILVALGGLPPGAVAELGVTGPGGPWTGRGVADADGRAVVEVPIDVAATFTFVEADYQPDGDLAGAWVGLDLDASIPGRVVDASDLSSRCDVEVMLAALEDGTGDPDVTRAAAEAVVTESAGLLPVLGVLRHPGTDFSIGGAYTVAAADDHLAVTTPDGVLDLHRSGTSGYHGAWVTSGATPGAAARWFEALPCGPGQLALGACAGGDGPLADGEWAAIAVAPDATLPVGDPAGSWTLRVTVGGREYVTESTDGGTARLRVAGGPSAARSFLRDDTALLLVPLSEVGGPGFGYRVELDVGGDVETFPAAGADAGRVGYGRLDVVAPPGDEDAAGGAREADPAEVVAAFLPRLFEALGEHGGFAFDHLHPAAIDRYGADRCQAFVGSRDHPADLEVEVRSVGDPLAYRFELDGLSGTLPGAYPVELVLRTGGDEELRTVHVWLVERDGDPWFPLWLTDCGEPVPGDG